tara:strand:- start:304 stop:639 length:336 start_codon:yes stop_codon:yes gene_type:complete
MNWKEKAKNHFINCQPAEGCGLLAKKDGIEFFWPCKNIASEMEDEITFALNPVDYAACEDNGAEVLAVIHSHVMGSSDPSETDKDNCRIFMLDWYIYSIQDDSWYFMETES